MVIRILEEYQKMLTPLFEEGERKDGLVVNAEAHAKELEEQYTKTLHEQEALVEELRKAKPQGMTIKKAKELQFKENKSASSK